MNACRRYTAWLVGALLVPASLAAQLRPLHPPSTVVAPNYRTEILAFERGLKLVGTSVGANGCKVMVLEATPAPTHVQFATGVAGTLVRYAIRAGYGSGQASPSQQTLMAAGNCALGGAETVPHSGGTTAWPLGGYPRNGRMWRNCGTPPCAVYPPTAWGPSNTSIPGGATVPFRIRVPSAPGLGRVIFRLYAYAATSSGGPIAVIDSTNAVAVAY